MCSHAAVPPPSPAQGAIARRRRQRTVAASLKCGMASTLAIADCCAARRRKTSEADRTPSARFSPDAPSCHPTRGLPTRATWRCSPTESQLSAPLDGTNGMHPTARRAPACASASAMANNVVPGSEFKVALSAWRAEMDLALTLPEARRPATSDFPKATVNRPKA